MKKVISVEKCEYLNKMQFLLRKSLSLPNKVTIGLELEFGIDNWFKLYQRLQNGTNVKIIDQLTLDYFALGRIKTAYHHNWKIRYEPSIDQSYLGISGGELVSPIIQDNKNAWLELKEMCELLKSNGAFINSQCGGHFHIGKQIFEENSSYLINFVKFWAVFEKLMHRYYANERLNIRTSAVNIGYACPLRDFILDLIFKESYEKYNYHSLIQRLNGDRSRTLEFCGLEGNDTIEFRLPNGTLNEVIWQNNTNVGAKMLLYCCNDNFDKELIEQKLCKLYDEEEPFSTLDEAALVFSDLVFDNELDKDYFLKQTFKLFDSDNSSYCIKKVDKNRLLV